MKNFLPAIIVIGALTFVFGIEYFHYHLCRSQNLSALYCLMQK